MALQRPDAEKLQRGFAYLAHAARSDGMMVNASSEDLGDWREAAFVFSSCTTELLYQLANILNVDVATLCERLAVGAALSAAEGAAPA